MSSACFLGFRNDNKVNVNEKTNLLNNKESEIIIDDNIDYEINERLIGNINPNKDVQKQIHSILKKPKSEEFKLFSLFEKYCCKLSSE